MNEDEDFAVQFDLADIVTEVIKTGVKKLKCSLNSINELVKNSELKKLYDELKLSVDDILQNDLQKCVETKGLQEKLS